MLDAGRHSNIEILTNSEIVSLKGEAGNFRATIRRHPRYVSEALCTGCGQCVEDCPVVLPNEFDVGMGARKAIYTPFAQAVPNTYIIDREHCLNDEFLVCQNCVDRHLRGWRKNKTAVIETPSISTIRARIWKSILAQ